MDVADFLQLQRAFEGEGVEGAAAEEEDVAGAGEVARGLGDLRLEGQRLGDEAGGGGEGGDEAGLLGGVDAAALAGGGDGEARRGR